MRTKIISVHLFIILLSLFIAAFAYWAYRESLYYQKIKDSFSQKSINSLDSLEHISALSNQNVLIRGIIEPIDSFKNQNGESLVLERILIESKKNRSDLKWQTDKDNSYIKSLPFLIKDNSDFSVLVNINDLEKSFITNPKTENLNDNGKILKKSIWSLKPGDQVYVLGNVTKQGQQIIINSPNLSRTSFSQLFNREPFIVSNMNKNEITEKSRELQNSMYTSALAFFIVGIFFLLSSFLNIIKYYNKEKEVSPQKSIII